MKYTLILSTALLLTACQTNANSPWKQMFGANIVPEESNSAQVVIHDAGGLPGAAQTEAQQHCSQFNKSAVFQTKKTGGNCWSVPCQVFRCVD